MDQPGILDRFRSRIASRKLAVFIIASIFMYMGKIESEHWAYVAVIYIGTQAALDGYAKMKGA